MMTTRPELQTRLRELVRTDDLPLEPPRIREPQTPGVPADPFMRIRTDEAAECVICLERAPDVSYVYRDGRQIRVHASCHAVWRKAGELEATQRACRTESPRYSYKTR